MPDLRELTMPEGGARPLEGAHLDLDLRARVPPEGSYVYAGFLSSLDGRIGVAGTSGPPAAIANERDWRLFVELLMQADVVISSGRYVRDVSAGDAQPLLPDPGSDRFADLFEWRRARGLPERPAVAILTTSGEFEPDSARALGERVLVISGRRMGEHRIRSLGEADIETVLLDRIDGPEDARARGGVEAPPLLAALRARDLRLVCSAAGPKVLATLAPLLDALFLTVATRLVGGRRFSTLFEGPPPDPAISFELGAAHYDASAPAGAGQLFLEFVRTTPPTGASADGRAPQ